MVKHGGQASDVTKSYLVIAGTEFSKICLLPICGNHL